MLNKDKHEEHVRELISRMFIVNNYQLTKEFQSVELIPYISEEEMSQLWGNVYPLELQNSINKYVREYLYEKYQELEKTGWGKYKLNPSEELYKRISRKLNE